MHVDCASHNKALFLAPLVCHTLCFQEHNTALPPVIHYISFRPPWPKSWKKPWTWHENSACWHHSILTMWPDPFLPPQRQMEKCVLAMRDYKNMIVGSMQHYVFVPLLSWINVYTKHIVEFKDLCVIQYNKTLPNQWLLSVNTGVTENTWTLHSWYNTTELCNDNF